MLLGIGDILSAVPFVVAMIVLVGFFLSGIVSLRRKLGAANVAINIRDDFIKAQNGYIDFLEGGRLMKLAESFATGADVKLTVPEGGGDLQGQAGDSPEGQASKTDWVGYLP